MAFVAGQSRRQTLLLPPPVPADTTDQTQVARYRAFPETTAGFALPTSASTS